LAGPLAPPGTYRVELIVEGQTRSASFEIRADPRLAATQADLEAQFELHLRIRDKLSATHDAVNQIRSVRQQLDDWVGRTKDRADGAAAAEAARGFLDKLAPIEQELAEERVKAPAEMLHYPTRLNARLAALTSVVASAESPPTRQAYEVFDDLSARIDVQLERWREAREVDLARFNEAVRTAGLPAVILPPGG
jgi:hypothetical protein